MGFDKEEILELRRRVLRKDFSRMNDRQQQAVFHSEGPVLILAGASASYSKKEASLFPRARAAARPRCL